MSFCPASPPPAPPHVTAHSPPEGWSTQEGADNTRGEWISAVSPAWVVTQGWDPRTGSLLKLGNKLDEVV